MERMSLLCTLLALVVGIQGLDVTIGGDSPSLSGVINQKFDSSIKPVMSQQLLTSFQHMITQAFNDLENRMEDKLSQLQSDLNDKVTSIQIKTESILQQYHNIDIMVNAQRSSLENIEDKVNDQTLKLNDQKLKLENIETGTLKDINEKVNNQQDNLLVLSKCFEIFEKNMDRIVDKISQIDIKLSVIDSQAIQKKTIKTIKTQIDEQFSRVINATQVTEDTVSKTSSLLTSLQTQSINFQNVIKESYQQMLSNVTREMDEMFNRDKNLTDLLQSNFLSLKNDVAMSWQNLQSSANKSTVEATKALQKATSDLNLTLISIKESALINFSLAICEKNLQVSHLSPLYPGVYKTRFPGLNVPVLCDTTTSGGGWIIIQRRSTGEVDFYKDWASYKEGFGSLDTEFWLGNDNIHKITASGDFELRVDLKYEGKSYYAAYSNFSVSGEDSGYTLTVEGYSGTAGDSLGYHNGMKFTTFDKDNDGLSGRNCAEFLSGAWWYYNCFDSNLNGKWGDNTYKTLCWQSLTLGNSVSFSQMKIRQK